MDSIALVRFFPGDGLLGRDQGFLRGISHFLSPGYPDSGQDHGLESGNADRGELQFLEPAAEVNT